jgi:DDE superfamily endonuclease
MPLCQTPQDLSPWFDRLIDCFDARTQGRFANLLHGALFAQGRRTVSSWLRAAGVGDDFRAHYYALSAVGRRVALVAFRLFICILRPKLEGTSDRLLFGLDDTPTKRYGPCIEGAGKHHNPTPGPAGSKFCYGHVWVTLALLLRHPDWGTIALPLLARLYVRVKDIGPLRIWYGWKFRTKLEQAADLIGWMANCAKCLARPLWLVMDGAYAKRPVLQAAKAAEVTVVSRLRHDAALFDEPPVSKRPGTSKPRGRPRIYGKNRISLCKRAGQPRGWQEGEFELYGQKQKKRYKSFRATWRPAGGPIRVVIVKRDATEPNGKDWIPYFSTNPDATPAEVLTAAADRSSLEQCYKDLKEVEGVSQQQVRNVWANVGAFHIGMWLHTLTEWWAWDRPEKDLVDRSQSPWDREPRRPSHADRRKALRKQGFREEFRRAEVGRGSMRKILRLAQGLLAMIA